MVDLKITVQGFSIDLKIPDERVFVPNLCGLLNAALVRLRRDDVVADVGTGAGLHAILCAKLGARRVYGIDINPDAVACAQRNARLNGVADRCIFKCGSVLEPFARNRVRLDLIVTTLPQTPEAELFKEQSMRSFPKVARYLSGGKDGGDLYIQLIEQARSFLKPDGRIHFHSVPWSSPDKVARAAQQAGFYLKTLMETRVPWWAKRCNIRSWIARHQNHGSLMINYRKMIVPRGFRVRVAEISRRRITDSGRRPCGTVRIAWEKVPASWACN